MAWYEQAARGGCATNSPLRALLLGVTAEIATMDWPVRTNLVAVDWAEAMIKRVWPVAGLPPYAAVIRADWFDMPLGESSLDFVVGDGCYTALGSLDKADTLNRAVSRVLRPGGRFAIRCFSRSEESLDVDHLFDELLTGRHTDLGLFHWFLMMALQGEQRDGVRLDKLWRVGHERVPHPGEYIERFGWIPEEIANIERYRVLDDSYVYPTIAELKEIAAPDFHIHQCDIPNYPHGQHFPRLILEKKM
jgi:SAM-dependent methyltransferase